jgi:hypothetical protein
MLSPGNALPLFAGIRIISAELTKTIAWRTERKWSHRKRHNPGQAFKYRSKQVPDTETCYQTPAGLVMHPETAQRLRNAVDAQPSPSARPPVIAFPDYPEPQRSMFMDSLLSVRAPVHRPSIINMSFRP